MHDPWPFELKKKQRSLEFRRSSAVLAALALLIPRPSQALFSSKKDSGFGLSNVTMLAHDLAQKPYQAPAQVPEPFHSLTFDQWRDIRYRTQKALWQDDGIPFNVEFYHPGFLYDASVAMNTIESGKAEPVPFSSQFFDYGKTGLEAKVPSDLGFAGFRIHFPINRRSYKDEILVFLGASYFRAVAEGQAYGLSGRGIAVNTALPSGEEFPSFREFWIQKPRRADKDITIFALLDGKSLTGAYRFMIRPGRQTTVRVDARLFLRASVERLGVAPLTGMFLYGENKAGKAADDFRPEIHDCDGLSLSLDRQEWVWRPLVNIDRLFVNVFRVNRLQGFGLMQRDENYDHYLDLEQHYEKRPSVWIYPRGDWGPGTVDLVQIPTIHESDDNIVAFWVPDRKLSANDSLDMSYTQVWSSAEKLLPPMGYVTYTDSMHAENNRIKFIIEFNGADLASLAPTAKVTAAISAPEGTQIEDVVVQKNDVTTGWRLVFKVKTPNKPTVEQILPQKKEAVELRAALQLVGRTVTETWSYAFDQP